MPTPSSKAEMIAFAFTMSLLYWFFIHFFEVTLYLPVTKHSLLKVHRSSGFTSLHFCRQFKNVMFGVYVPCVWPTPTHKIVSRKVLTSGLCSVVNNGAFIL